MRQAAELVIGHEIPVDHKVSALVIVIVMIGREMFEDSLDILGELGGTPPPPPTHPTSGKNKRKKGKVPLPPPPTPTTLTSLAKAEDPMGALKNLWLESLDECRCPAGAMTDNEGDLFGEPPAMPGLHR